MAATYAATLKVVNETISFIFLREESDYLITCG